LQISRVKRSRSAAKGAYDRLSHIYDWLTGSSETQYMHLGLEMLAINAGETILEIGPGTGKALVELCHQIGDSGQVHALDLSWGMMQKSQERMVSAGKLQRVNLLEGDGVNLPYKSGSFSAVFICFTLELFDTPDIPLVLMECGRVLAKDGRLGVVSMLKIEHPGRIVGLYEWLHEILPAYVDCRPIDGYRMIQAAGFSLEKRQVMSMWGLPVELMVARKV
jgi:ubiquinone/menaquinone biosynthesis C-methylase UbiE